MRPSGRDIYGGVSADDRRAARRARLIDAALELIGRDGWQLTTVRGVCAAAKLTPRYFYESFSDLDALLLVVFEQAAGAAAARVLVAIEAPGGSAQEKARSAIAAFAEFVEEDPRMARVLFVEAPGSGPLTLRRFETLRMFAELIAAEGRRFYGIEHGHDTLVATTALMLAGGLAETLLAWVEGSLQSGRDELVDNCVELFVAAGHAAVATARARDRERRRPPRPSG